jgi:TM2 domain-containing membrane protein YozV
MDGFEPLPVDYGAWRPADPQSAKRESRPAPQPPPVRAPAAPPPPPIARSRERAEAGPSGYWLLSAGQQHGPYSLLQVKSMWASGKLTLSAQYRAPGETLWSPIADFIEELERPDARPKSRALYIVLGIFLGLLGVHNFYAARYRRGLVQLLMPIIGSIVFLLAMTMLKGDIDHNFMVATAAIDAGQPAKPLSTSTNPIGIALAALAAAMVLTVPFWVIGELIFVTRDGRGHRMI